MARFMRVARMVVLMGGRVSLKHVAKLLGMELEEVLDRATRAGLPADRPKLPIFADEVELLARVGTRKQSWMLAKHHVVAAFTAASIVIESLFGSEAEQEARDARAEWHSRSAEWKRTGEVTVQCGKKVFEWLQEHGVSVPNYRSHIPVTWKEEIMHCLVNKYGQTAEHEEVSDIQRFLSDYAGDDDSGDGDVKLTVQSAEYSRERLDNFGVASNDRFERTRIVTDADEDGLVTIKGGYYVLQCCTTERIVVKDAPAATVPWDIEDSWETESFPEPTIMCYDAKQLHRAVREARKEGKQLTTTCNHCGKVWNFSEMLNYAKPRKIFNKLVQETGPEEAVEEFSAEEWCTESLVLHKPVKERNEDVRYVASTNRMGLQAVPVHNNWWDMSYTRVCSLAKIAAGTGMHLPVGSHGTGRVAYLKALKDLDKFGGMMARRVKAGKSIPSALRNDYKAALAVKHASLRTAAYMPASLEPEKLKELEAASMKFQRYRSRANCLRGRAKVIAHAKADSLEPLHIKWVDAQVMLKARDIARQNPVQKLEHQCMQGKSFTTGQDCDIFLWICPMCGETRWREASIMDVKRPKHDGRPKGHKGKFYNGSGKHPWTEMEPATFAHDGFVDAETENSVLAGILHWQGQRLGIDLGGYESGLNLEFEVKTSKSTGHEYLIVECDHNGKRLSCYVDLFHLRSWVTEHYAEEVRTRSIMIWRFYGISKTSDLGQMLLKVNEEDGPAALLEKLHEKLVTEARELWKKAKLDDSQKQEYLSLLYGEGHAALIRKLRAVIAAA
jgi:hypothetical protein